MVFANFPFIAFTTFVYSFINSMAKLHKFSQFALLIYKNLQKEVKI